MSHIDPAHDHETTAAAHPTHDIPPPGRRPMSAANWVGLVLLLAAIAFYLAFAIPEFFGIVGQMP
ncbi:MAG TPA: hypothetical protein VD906_03330 [Caulobacteraceae bacterium]|nr:hypothetical protein [Caulobacteraceae bacterium]